MFDCEICAQQNNCEIRDRILEVEEEHGVKLIIGFCPHYQPEQLSDQQINLLELFPDDHLDPDDFSEEDLV